MATSTKPMPAEARQWLEEQHKSDQDNVQAHLNTLQKYDGTADIAWAVDGLVRAVKVRDAHQTLLDLDDLATARAEQEAAREADQYYLSTKHSKDDRLTPTGTLEEVQLDTMQWINDTGSEFKGHALVIRDVATGTMRPDLTPKAKS